MLDIEMPDLDGLARAAAAARKEARPDRHHGLDAHPPERGSEPEGALARRRRLYPEARDQPRGHHVGGLPPRADRKDPPARRAAQARHHVATPAEPRARQPFAVPSAPGTAVRQKFSVAEPRSVALHPGSPDIKLRPFSAIVPRVLLIGSSTGGPQALTGLVERIKPVYRPRAGPDHAAHAADLHDHSGRASRARERPDRRTRRSTASRSCPARSISRPAAST